MFNYCITEDLLNIVFTYLSKVNKQFILIINKNHTFSLEREVQHLQQSSNPETSSDALVQHTLRKYEALKEELECFQKR